MKYLRHNFESISVFLFILASSSFNEISCESSVINVLDRLVTSSSISTITFIEVVSVHPTTISPSTRLTSSSVASSELTSMSLMKEVSTTHSLTATPSPFPTNTDSTRSTTTTEGNDATTAVEIPTTSKDDEESGTTTATKDGRQFPNLNIPTDLLSLIAIVVSCASFCCMLMLFIGCLLSRRKRSKRKRAHIQEEAARVATLQRPLSVAIKDSFPMTFENPTAKEVSLPPIVEMNESSLPPRVNQNTRKYSTAW